MSLHQVTLINTSIGQIRQFGLYIFSISGPRIHLGGNRNQGCWTVVNPIGRSRQVAGREGNGGGENCL